MVDLAGLVTLLVDGADFHREHEAHGAAAVLGQFLFHGGAAAGFELVQPFFGRFELLRQLGKPHWMRVIAGADDVNALECRPLVQIGGVECATGRSRKTRVQMYVDYELHVGSPLTCRVALIPSYPVGDHNAQSHQPHAGQQIGRHGLAQQRGTQQHAHHRRHKAEAPQSPRRVMSEQKD